MVCTLGACPPFSPQHDLTDVPQYAKAALPADEYTRLYLLTRQERERNHTVAAEVIRLVNVLFAKVRDIRQRAAYRTPAAGYRIW